MGDDCLIDYLIFLAVRTGVTLGFSSYAYLMVQTDMIGEAISLAQHATALGKHQAISSWGVRAIPVNGGMSS